MEKQERKKGDGQGVGGQSLVPIRDLGWEEAQEHLRGPLKLTVLAVGDMDPEVATSCSQAGCSVEG